MYIICHRYIDINHKRYIGVEICGYVYELLMRTMPLGFGYDMSCAGAIQGKERGIQVLAGLAPSRQPEGSLYRSALLAHERQKER
jgi:hypothetical protein